MRRGQVRPDAVHKATRGDTGRVGAINAGVSLSRRHHPVGINIGGFIL
ncbi:MAG: hypothetical protein IMX01_08865 [Limnochordaceae bacterium]|nr:hypothetical protein [Limnochordaceae bacterium]